MMISDIISTTAVLPLVRAASCKQLLQTVARHAAQLSGLDADEIAVALMAREKAGSTAVGGGVAIPHGRLAKLGRSFALLAHLEAPVDFNALDGGRVDLVAVLLSPDQASADHLKALAALSRLLRDRQLCDRLRGCRDADAMYALVTAGDAKRAA
jgi:nitrogen PTS system EIIA component